MLVDLFNSVTDGAYTLLLVYLVKIYLALLLGYAAAFFGIYHAARLLQKVITSFSLSAQVMDKFGYSGDPTSRERNHILKTIEDALNR